MMLMGSDKTMKIGGALMAMGVAAAVTAGIVNSKNSTKRKMKKLGKKTVKTVDNVLDMFNQCWGIIPSTTKQKEKI